MTETTPTEEHVLSPDPPPTPEELRDGYYAMLKQLADILRLLPEGYVVPDGVLQEGGTPGGAYVEPHLIMKSYVEAAQAKLRDQQATIRKWRDWGSRLMATMAAQPAPGPYSRAMLDSVMADCPLKIDDGKGGSKSWSG